MAKKALETLTESMFYVLMALEEGPKCGTEVSDYVDVRSGGRVLLGPATLYTVLGRFEDVGYIRQIAVRGRKRTYEITKTGMQAYQREISRLRVCLSDTERK